MKLYQKLRLRFKKVRIVSNREYNVSDSLALSYSIGYVQVGMFIKEQQICEVPIYETASEYSLY